jgi:hypothetical protein
MFDEVLFITNLVFPKSALPEPQTLVVVGGSGLLKVQSDTGSLKK